MIEPDAHSPESGRIGSRVIPVMREAVTTVQLLLFTVLRLELAMKYDGWAGEDYRRLVGTLVSDLFGSAAQDTVSVQFAREHLLTVEEELRALPATVPDLLAILTDALRMQTLCDHEEGVNTLPTLLRAKALGVLQEERPLPLPSTFMIAVRKLGTEYGLIEEMRPNPPGAE